MPQKISKTQILRYFSQLPAEQRVKILRANLSLETIDDYARSEYRDALYKLRSVDEKEARSFLSDVNKVGATPKELVAVGGKYASTFQKDIFSRYGANPSDLDKMYALLTSNTMSGRLNLFWPAVKGKVKTQYEDKGLASVGLENLQKLLGNPTVYAPGKSLESLAKDVVKIMDPAKLKELSQEKSLMQQLQKAVPANDPQRREKLTRAAELCMILPESKLDPEDLKKKLQDKDWEKKLNAADAIEREMNFGLTVSSLTQQIRTAMRTYPQTAEEKSIFQDAVTRITRDINPCVPESYHEDPEYLELQSLPMQLDTERFQSLLKQQPAQSLRDSLAAEYRTLDKEKSGFLLSKTNTPEHNNMMKSLRLFNAKLDLISGKQPEGLTEEELKTAKNTSADVLLENAKRGCYNYGCLKTGNGTKGFWHDAGSERFESSMKSLKQLNELGKKLQITEPAAALRDENQRELLQNRRDKNWLAEHAADMAAKSIYAQKLLKEGVSAKQQEKLLKDDALQAQVEKIKSKPIFKQMVKDAGPAGLADAMIKGVTGLAELYGKAAKAAEAKGHERTASEIAPAQLQAKEAGGGLSV